jgi:hypothetical protein
MVTSMVPRIRRGGFIFLAWVGDHSPRHVHVYRDSRLVVKWNLDEGVAMEGWAPNRVRNLIYQLEQEGEL